MTRLDQGTLDSERTGRWLIAIGKHLSAFAATHPQLTSLYAITRSSKEGNLLLRLRGLHVVSGPKVEAIALDCGIPKQELIQTLQRIEQRTGLLGVVYTTDRATVEFVSETILTEQEVYRAVALLFTSAQPTSVELTMVPLIELLSRLPTMEHDAIQQLCSLGYSEEDLRTSIELQQAFGLLQRRAVPGVEAPILFNEYLWGRKIDTIAPVIISMKTKESDYVISLIEEVRLNQGQPVDRLSAAPADIITLAMSSGLIDKTTIITANGQEKSFAFTPHFYGYRAGPYIPKMEDTSDQVKLFLASIGYGVHHSPDFRLRDPMAFVDRLHRDGRAGNATPILRDYVLLERQGIVTVEETARGRGTFVLKKPDVVESALEVMKHGAIGGDLGGSNDSASLIVQRGFRSPEVNRLTVHLGSAPGPTSRFDEELIASIRDTVQKGAWS